MKISVFGVFGCEVRVIGGLQQELLGPFLSDQLGEATLPLMCRPSSFAIGRDCSGSGEGKQPATSFRYMEESHNPGEAPSSRNTRQDIKKQIIFTFLSNHWPFLPVGNRGKSNPCEASQNWHASLTIFGTAQDCYMDWQLPTHAPVNKRKDFTFILHLQ